MAGARRVLAALPAPLLAAGLVLSSGAGEHVTQLQPTSAVRFALQPPYTVRVSVTNRGRQLPYGVYGGMISMSDNGRMVVWDYVENLTTRAFVRDRWRGTTRLVSVDNMGRLLDTGNQTNARISGNGRYVVFAAYSRQAGGDAVFVRDLQAQTTRRVSVNRGGRLVQAWGPNISDDGRYIAFESPAHTLVRGDTNHLSDVFVRDMWHQRTVRVSVSSSGRQGNGESSTPTRVVTGRNGSPLLFFLTYANNLTPNHRPGVLGHDLATGRTWWAAGPMSVDVSTDARFLGFTKARRARPGYFYTQIYVRNRITGTTRLVSLNPLGQLFRNVDCVSPSLSADGRFVAFATSYPDGSGQVYLRDRLRHRTRLISVGFDGRPGSSGGTNWGSSQPDVSADGHVVAFYSGASNLVRHDTNGAVDAFVRQLR